MKTLLPVLLASFVLSVTSANDNDGKVELEVKSDGATLSSRMMRAQPKSVQQHSTKEHVITTDTEKRQHMRKNQPGKIRSVVDGHGDIEIEQKSSDSDDEGAEEDPQSSDSPDETSPPSTETTEEPQTSDPPVAGSTDTTAEPQTSDPPDDGSTDTTGSTVTTEEPQTSDPDEESQSTSFASSDPSPDPEEPQTTLPPSSDPNEGGTGDGPGTPRPPPTPGPPPFSGQPMLMTVMGVTGEIGRIWYPALKATFTDIMKQPTRLLTKLQLLAEGEECADCEKIGIRQTWECCVEIMQDGAIVSDASLLRQDEPLVVEVTLASEGGLSYELVHVLRGLKLPADMYRKVGPLLHSLGMYKPEQLLGLDPARVTAELGLNRDDPLAKIFASKLTEAMSAVIEARNVEAPKSQISTQVKGEKWNVEQLIRRNGLFRGLRIANPGQDDTNLQEAVQFTSSAALSTQFALETSMLLQPDLKTSELNLESSNTQNVNSANVMLESFGTSSLRKESESWAFSLGVDLNVIGIPVGIDLGFGAEDKSTRLDKSTSVFKDNKHLEEKSHTYQKTRYFVEPRQMIVVDPAWLQPTPALKEAFRRVKISLEDANNTNLYSVDHLFRDFGTHTCTRAMLGGWWKISARYSSLNAHKVVEMSTATTNAIDNVVEHSSHFKLGVEAYGVVEADFNHKKDERTQQKEDSRRDLVNKEVIKDNNSMIDIAQEWKGGISGLQAEEWRASLDADMNSNWKIIDRYVDSCMGIWRWVEDDEVLKRKICEGWRTGFIRDMLELGANSSYEPSSTEEWNSCTGAAYMGSFRDRVMEQRRQAEEVAASKTIDACEKMGGFHWRDGGCRVNQCKCGNAVGTVGPECPEDGAEKCKDDQLAKCKSMQCPRLYWNKPDPESQKQLCASRRCTENADLERCCQPVYITDTFTVEIWTANGAGCEKDGGAKVEYQIFGPFGSTKRGNIGEGPRRGAYVDYHVDSENDGMMRADRICLYWTRGLPHHRWCPGDTVKIYNAHMTKGSLSLVGTATGWTTFYTPVHFRAEQCRPIVYKAVAR